MPDVFSQIYLHVVFSPKHRQALILPEWEDRLHRYITGIVQDKGHKMLAIGGMPDHIHLFIGFKPSEAISDLVREIKKRTNTFVNTEGLSAFPFEWQNGFGSGRSGCGFDCGGAQICPRTSLASIAGWFFRRY
jgi:REP element-mobilizing transposase RayT